MQAVILAAGLGNRLGYITKNHTKSMIKVNGICLIDYMLNGLVNTHSVNRIILIIGHQGDEIKQYIGTEFNQISVVYITNSRYAQTNNIYSLYLAKDYLCEDDTLVLESDILFEDSIITKLIEHPFPNLSVVAKYQNWMNGTMVFVDKDNYISQFISPSAFSIKDKDEYYKTVNIHKFSKEFSQDQYIPFLEAYIKAFSHTAYYEQILSVLTMIDKTNLKALKLTNEKWYEIDDVKDLAIAETLFSSEQTIFSNYQKHYGGYWRYPDLIDFCYLVNPYFPSEEMMSELKFVFTNLITQYPSGSKDISLLAASLFVIREDYICVGNGAAELIRSLLKLLPGNIGLIYPTFDEYSNSAQQERIVPYYYSQTDFSYTPQEIISFFEDKSLSILVLINPDNPSGQIWSKDEVLILLNWCGINGIRLILDESFIDFSSNFTENSFLSDKFMEEYINLIIIKSLSKSYGIPGLRLGVVCSGDIDLISTVKKDLPIWNINSIAEYFLLIMPKYKDDYYKSHLLFVKERSRMFKELESIYFLRIIPSEANYFLCEIKSFFSSFSLATSLIKEHNILIKDCSQKKGFNNKSYVRIAIKSKLENDILLKVLKEYDA